MNLLACLVGVFGFGDWGGVCEFFLRLRFFFKMSHISCVEMLMAPVDVIIFFLRWIFWCSAWVVVPCVVCVFLDYFFFYVVLVLGRYM